MTPDEMESPPGPGSKRLKTTGYVASYAGVLGVLGTAITAGVMSNSGSVQITALIVGGFVAIAHSALVILTGREEGP